MNKILFKEEQKQKYPWIWMILFPLMGLLLYFFSWKENDGILNPQKEDDALGLIIVGISLFVMMVVLTLLFYKMHLKLEIKTDGIHFKYPPFINKEKFIPKETIDRYVVRKYNPNREYGGHGVKKRLIKNMGRAYTVYGKTGLQLYLKNGEKVLIGTQRKEPILHAMDKMINTD
ncbi:MAG: hypothetical protein JW731_15070 [Bacteroidales bacterium]|nr:hypothetical protein [Bacteroidales bacterium]